MKQYMAIDQYGHTEHGLEIVQEDGHILSCDAKEARKAWETRNTKGLPSDELAVLKAENVRLREALELIAASGCESAEPLRKKARETIAAL